MERLGKIYGKASYDKWQRWKPSDLTDTKVEPEEANNAVWEVRSYRELVEKVAFLASMNKRYALFYRGQRHDYNPLPMLFRDSWRCFHDDKTFKIGEEQLEAYWQVLDELGSEVFHICRNTAGGVPRKRGLRDIREVQWAVIQHYELWPTPLIDITSSLRVAATFAMGFQRGTAAEHSEGYLYVVAMPHLTGSIGFDIDRHIVLARLQSCVPATACRPHFQDGFLLGRFPMYEATPRIGKKSSLLRRLVAKFKLIDDGSFWNADFPMIPKAALLPDNDALLRAFRQEFGSNGPGSIRKRAEKLAGDA